MAYYTKRTNDLLPLFEESVSVLCWAYNEEELIEEFLYRINSVMKSTVRSYEIIVIDDCSTDKTNAKIREIQELIPEIKLFRNETNRNVGYSCKRAIQEASKKYLFWQTIDWSYDITMFRTFLDILSGCDVVAGVRRAPVKVKTKWIKPLAGILKLTGVNHITRRSDTIFKAFVSVMNYSLIRILFSVPISDYQNIVFYSKKLIQGIEMEADSSFLNPELLLKAYWQGAHLVEVPIAFLPRQAGIAKGTKPAAIQASIKDIIFCWWSWIVKGRKVDKGEGLIIRLKKEEWETIQS